MRTILQHALPHKLVSKVASMCANCKVTWIKNFLINFFIKRFSVKMHEAVEENPFSYPSYNDFFTRALKPEARPIDRDPSAIVSPADGYIAQIGKIEQDDILQAKGHTYSLQALLGGQSDLAKTFENGSFATVYLSPKDYHRVHMPLGGKLHRMVYVPGKLFSVNDHAANNIPGVFARNERVICIFETSAGPMAVILVGAMIVGSIETVWKGPITPPHFKNINAWGYDESIILNKGDEMGRFKLGSTVIVLMAEGTSSWKDSILPSNSIQMGQKIGGISET